MKRNNANKYFAFISYKREDEEWATWLHHELENYHLPVSLNGRSDLPAEFRPIFRDIDELKAGNLSEQIRNALASSTFLIVICSPNAAKSEWVNKEILEFIEIGKHKGIDNIRNIFPFIVEGRPHAADQSEECFPDTLLNLSDEQERIGGDVNESGRDMAFIKTLAGMLPNVDFAELWNRYERDKAEQERLKREERERFLSIQSRFVSEKILDITDDSVLGQLLSLKILPSNLENPDRPYTVEAERALRQSTQSKSLLLTRYGATVETPKIAFSSDGHLVAVMTDEFIIKIWDTTTGSIIATMETGHPFGHSIAFSPDGSCLWAIFGDGNLVGWETEEWQIISLMKLNEILNIARSVSSLSFSSSGEKMAVSTLEGEVAYLDFVNDESSSFKIASVYSTAFSPDDKFLVTASEKGLKVWDIEDWSCGSLDIDEGKEALSGNAVFSPDGSSVAYFFDNTWGVLNTTGNNRNNLQRVERECCVSAVSFLNSGKRLAVLIDSGLLTIWDIESEQQVMQTAYPVDKIEDAEFSSDGSMVAYIDDNKRIVLVGILPVYLKESILLHKKCTCIDIHPDGNTVIIGTEKDETGNVLFFDFKTNKQHERKGHSGRIFSVVYSPKGDLILTASYDRTFRIWDSGMDKCLKTIRAKDVIGEVTAFSCASFNPLGNLIAAATFNGDIIIWDYVNDSLVRKLNHTSNPVFSVQFSPDGRYVASAGVDNDVKIWRLETGEIHHILKGHSYFVEAIRYSPDGKFLYSASRDNTLICWNAENGNIIWSNDSWSGILIGLSITKDGKYLAVGSCDPEKPICICDSATGKIIVSFSEIIEPINSMAFKPDGKSLVCVDAEGRMYIWEFPDLQTLIESVKTRLSTRILTTGELKQFYLE